MPRTGRPRGRSLPASVHVAALQRAWREATGIDKSHLPVRFYREVDGQRVTVDHAVGLPTTIFDSGAVMGGSSTLSKVTAQAGVAHAVYVALLAACQLVGPLSLTTGRIRILPDFDSASRRAPVDDDGWVNIAILRTGAALPRLSELVGLQGDQNDGSRSAAVSRGPASAVALRKRLEGAIARLVKFGLLREIRAMGVDSSGEYRIHGLDVHLPVDYPLDRGMNAANQLLVAIPLPFVTNGWFARLSGTQLLTMLLLYQQRAAFPKHDAWFAATSRRQAVGLTETSFRTACQELVALGLLVVDPSDRERWESRRGAGRANDRPFSFGIRDHQLEAAP